jgi:hypothetical protein
METDLRRLEEWLETVGVEYVRQVNTVRQCIYITTESGAKGVGGYSGFCTSFEFDMNGKFIEMGAYE